MSESFIARDVQMIPLFPNQPGDTLLLLESKTLGIIDLDELRVWIEHNRDSLFKQWYLHGALLFRGFNLKNPQDFEQLAITLDPDLKNNYLGTSPRNAVSRYVFTASELPPHYPIPQHCEMSFLPTAPRKLFFFCTTAPETNGETPITDFRKVYQDLPTSIREPFEAKGIQYVRNYRGPASKPQRFNPWQLKRWDEMFLTTDRQEVEKQCRDHQLEPVWLPDDQLRLINHRPAISTHPVTGEKVWFNHSQVFHAAAARFEYRHIVRRMPEFRYRKVHWMLELLTSAKMMTTRPEDHGMHCFYGDGTPISNDTIDIIQKTIWKHMTFFSWQAGDVLMIDNFSTSHGRMPYHGPREILVCWSADA